MRYQACASHILFNFRLSYCDTVGELAVILVLHFVFTNVAVSKSRRRLFFYPTKEGVKRTEKDPSRLFLSKGGRLWKRKLLAPFPSVVIYGLLDAKLILKYLVLCVFLKGILEAP